MKSFLELIKEKKALFIGIIVAVVLVIAIICIAVCTNKESSKNVKTPIKSETIVVTDKNGKVVKKEDKNKSKEETSKKTKSKSEKKKEKSAWDDVKVVEEGTKAKKDKEVLYKRNKKGEIVTNKKGEKVTRKASYAGEDEGWSPIVSPDDLKD